MKRPPLRFRIRVVGAQFVRISVCETRPDMWRALAECHGEPHRHEYAATIFTPGSPDRGCIADLFFYWRGLRPGIIAHEASHGAFAIAAATKQGIGPDDEHVAAWTEKITEKIWLRTQSAPL
jgi:hypothetical protein